MKNSASSRALSPQVTESECHAIANWWIEHAVDHANGGFFGEIDERGKGVARANKSLILNSRILWFFSEAAKRYKHPTYRSMADRAYRYLREYFEDKVHGGFVWELDYKGEAVNCKKQTYAQAFAIYGLSAYFALRQKPEVLTIAKQCFDLIESKTKDAQYGGYLEAFTQTWKDLSDMRLSDKDLNAPKSMNTHIHILEAYSTLYKVSKDIGVKSALASLVDTIFERILEPGSSHLYLFQQRDWKNLSTSYSYGHDIEASWLLWEAISLLNSEKLQKKYRPIVIEMSQVCLDQAIGRRGQVCDQYTRADNKKHEESFWWVQAEAIVGFLNAYEMTGQYQFLRAAESVWQFILDEHLDTDNGEWYWIAKCDQHNFSTAYKCGFWKGPYHNGRAMMKAADYLKNMKLQNFSHESLNVK